MSNKANNPNTESHREAELSDTELTEMAGGTDSRSAPVGAIKSESDRSGLQGGADVDTVQVNGSNTAGDSF